MVHMLIVAGGPGWGAVMLSDSSERIVSAVLPAVARLETAATFIDYARSSPALIRFDRSTQNGCCR
jgi:hypothetical protein